MRNLVIAALVAAVCAVPAMGTLTAKVVAPAELQFGEVGTVEVWVRGDTKGVWTVAGSVVASGDVVLSANAGSLAFDAAFPGNSTFLIGVGGTPALGTPGANGGWDVFVTSQGTFPANNNIGKADFAKALTYTVTAGDVAGTANLTFVDLPLNVNGMATGGGSLAIDRAWGEITGASITVVPEPMTMALLALGGLFVARRRSR